MCKTLLSGLQFEHLWSVFTLLPVCGQSNTFPKYILPYITKKSKEIRLLTKQAKRGLTWSRAQ